MDNARISRHHWKIMFISGMGFFTDAFDLFIIGVVMTLLKPLWHVKPLEESLVESTALLASALGALLFGRVADRVANGSTDLKCWYSQPVRWRVRLHRTSSGSSDCVFCWA